jgi:tRNA(Ile)-lysidine synthase
MVIIDHGLQDGSALQAARVASMGYELDLDPVEILPVTVGATGGPEAAARSARYAALARTAESLAARVLLGHTLDDQAETVLLGLGRGSGPRSIAGMRATDGCYLRPLLGVRRATTQAACAALGLQPWQDPHNTDPSFQRVRLRTEVLPLLEGVLQGGVAEALARTAELLRDDLVALDQLAGQVVSRLVTADAPDVLVVAELTAAPAAIRTRVLRDWAHGLGAGPLTAEHTAALDALVMDWHGQGPLGLPGARSVRRVSGKLVMNPPPPDLASGAKRGHA